MISLLDEDQKELGRFSTWSQVVDYIHKLQVYQLKYLTFCKYPFQERHAELLETAWSFVYYTHAELSTIYATLKNDITFTGRTKEAFDRVKDLIEICNGNLIFLEFPITPGLDIESLKKDWCEVYCKANGYALLESLDNESTDEDSAGLQTTGGANDLVV